MDPTIASEIATIEAALRTTLDDLGARPPGSAGREHTRELVRQAHELADRLSRTVDRLDDDDAAEGARRVAAYLAAQLAVLERDQTTALH